MFAHKWYAIPESLRHHPVHLEHQPGGTPNLVEVDLLPGL